MIKRLIQILICSIVLLISVGVVEVDAVTSNLVIRDANDYNNVDFSQMSLADYCLFFVQDTNIKYGKGMHCTGNGRSETITSYNSLQDICLNELSGGDNGIDCSALVYVIGKYFGSSADTSSTYRYSEFEVGVQISKKINAREEGFSELQIGDVIITNTRLSDHALICIGEVDGQMTMVHIGSSHMCNGNQSTNCTCCTIRPGVGVSFCTNCEQNITVSSGQNKRFIRTAAVEPFFSDMSDYVSVWIYRPFYSRPLGGNYSGTDYGSGANSQTITNWVQKTGSMVEEAEIIGMPGKFVFDGEPISLVGRDGLSVSDKANLTSIGTSIGSGKMSLVTVTSVIVSAIGIILILYAFMIIVASIFDISNNFIDISLLSILSFGRWQIVDDPDIKKSVKKDGKVLITKSDIIVRAVVIGLIGVLFISGVLLDGIGWVLNKLYG